MSAWPPPAGAEPVAFTPGLDVEDWVARHWLAQATLRLRREVCWLWRERALREGISADAHSSTLPPPADPARAALDLLRYDGERHAFFTNDPTGQHLSDRIAAPPPDLSGELRRGGFGSVVRELGLTPFATFALALALLPAVDGAAGAVIACCQNETGPTAPTLALAQRLWDDPCAPLTDLDPAHALVALGIVVLAPVTAGGEWQRTLTVPSLVGRMLLFPGQPLSAALRSITPGILPSALDEAALARVATALAPTTGLRAVPVTGPAGAPLDATVAACLAHHGCPLVRPAPGLPRTQLAPALTLAWLNGAAVYLPAPPAPDPDGGAETAVLPLPGLPLTMFVAVPDRAAARALGTTLPTLDIPPLDHAERIEAWRLALPATTPAALITEVARRFRFEREAIARVGDELSALDRAPGMAEIAAAARADLDLGALAQPVTPRFARAELMLPPAQSAQINEIVTAMRTLTRVHYDWGTARAWSEGGITVLFAGPPGTGKTMAAEAIASELTLPMYRIDLSQVVNKYIGETEKNLRTLFDAADGADLILFFDEADALFGKRTEVKDAHDRYANLEISYLLERMERFKGLAILATNRKKDLDEAFLRRLRFVVDIPLPGAAERARIWRGAIPPAVDASNLDFDFLADRFPLSGGHIRAIVFQACLQSAADEGPPRLEMPAVVRAVQREYQKLERASSLEQFGHYAPLVAAERVTR